jgi:hypothetical protein
MSDKQEIAVLHPERQAGMDSDWFTGIYLRIKQARDEKLAHILALLRPKVETDTEVEEAVRLLEGWLSNDEEICEPMSQTMRQGNGSCSKDGLD